MKLKMKLSIIILITVLVIFNTCLGIFLFNMSSVSNKKNENIVEINIENGASANTILGLLKEKNLIRSELFCKIYLKLSNYNIQAGIYEFSTNYSSMKIMKMLNAGDVTNKYVISLTFKEGKNIKDYVSVISSATNNTTEDVYNTLKDSNYIDELINKYWFLTDEIKQTSIYYPLEGYLFPETYYFDNKDVSVKTIFSKMLEQMNKVLIPYKSKIENKNMTIHEFLTLASIVELEGLYSNDRSMIAGVFYNRLKSGDTLGSDVTTYYAVGKSMGEYPVLAQADIDYVSPYNTRLSSMAGKLPIGPIGNPGSVSMQASIEPTSSEYYFFVADCKTGKTVFSKTFNEHVKAVNRIKANGCEF